MFWQQADYSIFCWQLFYDDLYEFFFSAHLPIGGQVASLLLRYEWEFHWKPVGLGLLWGIGDSSTRNERYFQIFYPLLANMFKFLVYYLLTNNKEDLYQLLTWLLYLCNSNAWSHGPQEVGVLIQSKLRHYKHQSCTIYDCPQNFVSYITHIFY